MNNKTEKMLAKAARYMAFGMVPQHPLSKELQPRTRNEVMRQTAKRLTSILRGRWTAATHRERGVMRRRLTNVIFQAEAKIRSAQVEVA